MLIIVFLQQLMLIIVFLQQPPLLRHQMLHFIDERFGLGFVGPYSKFFGNSFPSSFISSVDLFATTATPILEYFISMSPICLKVWIMIDGV